MLHDYSFVVGENWDVANAPLRFKYQYNLKYNMVELTVRLGQKGQVVIPKTFREAYQIYPREEAIMEAGEGRIIIRRKEGDIVERFRELARKMNIKKLDAKAIKTMLEQQYEEKAKRIGIKIPR